MPCNANTFFSDESKQPLATNNTHVSYYRGPRFHDVAVRFVEEAGGWDSITLESETDRKLALFADRALAERWHAHHREHAILGLLTSKENQRRPLV
ncbi:hypothetical protein [Streptomyces sp. C10-9-1]|uniref:hypothetical protein n=1 Tax=Streptomyces sp. C10-9-1 TaxID=1859285 RepID=UPI003D722F04